MYSRRFVVQCGAALGAALALPRSLWASRPLLASLGGSPELVPPVEDPRLRELIQRALDAARGAGATYADVRLTHGRSRALSVLGSSFACSDYEAMNLGVRALVQGYWGFASSPIWSPDEAARLGAAAAALAKTTVSTAPRVVELAPAPTVPDGHWTMPIQSDPFAHSPLELVDYLGGLNEFINRMPHAIPKSNTAVFRTQAWAFGSTAGQYCTQRTFLTSGSLVLEVVNPSTREGIQRGLSTLSPTGVGLELYTGQPIKDNLRALYEELRQELLMPVKPVDIGRYDVVLDAHSVAAITSRTIGLASELDRALGYEANASGTSYLNQPAEMVGAFQVGSPLLTVSANRSEPGGAATVQWDDDGVTPVTYDVVRGGVLQRYQTTRESASWLPAGDTNRHASTGAAYASDANAAPLTRTANLTVAPGDGHADVDSLSAGLSRGVEFHDMGLSIDFQQLNGLGIGRGYEIKGGKRIARLSTAGMIFRAPELWKSLKALGGASSAVRFGYSDGKGEPFQGAVHSVTAVPALFREIAVVDPMRRV